MYKLKRVINKTKKNIFFFKIYFCLALATVENLRIFSDSSKLKQIEVIYDPPIGSYDQLILTCETKSSKQRKKFPNSTICTDLIPNEFYRIYVETKRIGWESVNSTEIQFILPSIKGLFVSFF